MLLLFHFLASSDAERRFFLPTPLTLFTSSYSATFDLVAATDLYLLCIPSFRIPQIKLLLIGDSGMSILFRSDGARISRPLSLSIFSTEPVCKSESVLRLCSLFILFYSGIRSLRIAGVGKSCLLLRFSDDSFTTSFITTIGCVFPLNFVVRVFSVMHCIAHTLFFVF